MANDAAPSRWRTNLLLIIGVILTVLMALVMSSLDSLQRRFLPTAIVGITATTDSATVVPMPLIQSSATVTASPSSTRNPRLKPTAEAVSVLPTCGNVPENWVAYTVRQGDTLFYLSLNSGATIDEIVQANCLEFNRLVSGITIFLPSTPPVRIPCGPPPAWVPYIVQRHDTLFSLARSRGTTVFAVMQANCLTSTYLVAGRVLLLPPLAATATSPPPPPTSRPQPSPTSAVPTASSTPTPSTGPSATPTPTDTPSPTATAICLTPLPTGCQATLPARPAPISLGITAGWIGLGLIIGVVLAFEGPGRRERS